MTMRALLAGVVLSTAFLATSALASPLDGAWQEKHPPASIKGVTTAEGFKLTIWMKVNGEELDYYSENTTQPATPYISTHVSKLDGTVAPFPNQTRFNQVTTLLTEPRELAIMKMKDGDVLAGEYWSFSVDGKSAVRRGVGKRDGKSYPYQEHFVKVDAKPQHKR